MSLIKPPVIKEIARAIASGNTCYLQRFSGEVTTIDNSIEDPEALEIQKEKEAEIERKIESYVKIENLKTQDQLVIMRDFLEEVPDKSVRKQLSNALNRKNPVRNFNQAVENDLELNQHWVNFNFEEYQRWVSNVIIDAYNY